jgi:hypothetical protein
VFVKRALVFVGEGVELPCQPVAGGIDAAPFLAFFGSGACALLSVLPVGFELRF